VGAAVLFVVGVLFGFLLGRTGNDEELAGPNAEPGDHHDRDATHRGGDADTG
jgi:hypothetical protein